MTRIVAATHKEYKIPDDPLYIPVMAGSALRDAVPAAYCRDDSGDNISEKNASYCELTALYYAWKNLTPDNTGLCHYRRYFASPANRKAVLSLHEAEALMSEYDAVLPKPRNYVIETNYSQYVHAHHKADLDLTREIVAENHPQYLKHYDRRMKMTCGHRFNMFLLKKEAFESYCSWLFSILFELEKRLDVTDYSEKDKRVFGYVAERLLDVWLDCNGCSYKELRVVFTEKENLPGKAIAMLIRKIRHIWKR